MNSKYVISHYRRVFFRISPSSWKKTYYSEKTVNPISPELEVSFVWLFSSIQSERVSECYQLINQNCEVLYDWLHQYSESTELALSNLRFFSLIICSQQWENRRVLSIKTDPIKWMQSVSELYKLKFQGLYDSFL